MSKADKLRNSKILEQIELNRARITAAKDKYSKATETEKNSPAFILGMKRVAELEAETDKMEREFIEGTIKLKPGRKAKTDNLEDSLESEESAEESAEESNERRQIHIDSLEAKLVKMQEEIETKQLELDSLKLIYELKKRDFAKRIAETKAKMITIEDL
jgi:hypothetical protein